VATSIYTPNSTTLTDVTVHQPVQRDLHLHKAAAACIAAPIWTAVSSMPWNAAIARRCSAPSGFCRVGLCHGGTGSRAAVVPDATEINWRPWLTRCGPSVARPAAVLSPVDFDPGSDAPEFRVAEGAGQGPTRRPIPTGMPAVPQPILRRGALALGNPRAILYSAVSRPRCGEEEGPTRPCAARG
jgi:hypothetical protein